MVSGWAGFGLGYSGRSGFGRVVSGWFGFGLGSSSLTILVGRVLVGSFQVWLVLGWGGSG